MKLDFELFCTLINQASSSERKRAHYNLHQTFEDPVQRLCIGLVKRTYTRPHYHTQAYKWEMIVGLQGLVGLVIFDDEGLIIDKLLIEPGISTAGIEMPPNTWHCIYPVSESAVVLEIKQGPYTPARPTDFASWAPQEGDANVPHFLTWLEQATLGERYPVNHYSQASSG